LHTNWRRRSKRQRRVILWNRREGSSEGKGRGDESWGSDVGNGSKFRRSGRGNVGLDNQSRENAFRIDRHFER
jgi:hypothetical protein